MDFSNIFEDDHLSERDIQLLYETHPYLIDPKFLNAKIHPQYPLPSGFADIVIFQAHALTVIELKIDPLLPKHVLQLNEYMQDLHKLFPSKAISGILIGQPPKNSLTPLLSNLNFPVQIKILKDDVPIAIKTCKNCRLANPSTNKTCNFCSCNEWLE